MDEAGGPNDHGVVRMGAIHSDGREPLAIVGPPLLYTVNIDSDICIFSIQLRGALASATTVLSSVRMVWRGPHVRKRVRLHEIKHEIL